MSASNASTSVSSATRPNGAGAAAILAAGIGAFLVAVFAILADQSAAIKSLMIFWKPTGPLSGVTTVAIALWIVCWTVLAVRWRNKTLAFGKLSAFAFLFLAFGLLLTFPPFGDLLLGR